jgi:trehalose-phosphatase
MRALDPKLDLDDFFAAARQAPQRVLMLDYDGTLAPFHADPRLALPYPRACAVLRELACPSMRIVIVSGRRLQDLRAPLALLPHTEVWASHGWEHAAGGRVTRRVPNVEVRHALAHAAACARPLAREGVRIEEKVGSVALHWRGLAADSVALIRDTANKAWEPLEHDELALVAFDGGLELRARAWGKGDAARCVLAACAPGAACAYVGDDTSDEEAFRAIRGKGLSVLLRESRRNTCATVWLSQPWELSRFLERWRCEGACS